MHPEIGKTEAGDALHYSVGIVIKQNGKFLLIDRATEPFGFALLAGHIYDNEEPEKAARRTVEEEIGQKADSCRFIFETMVNGNWCNRGIGEHYWRVYECEISDEPKLIFLKAKSIGWYSSAEMKKLKFDPAVGYLFKKMKVI